MNTDEVQNSPATGKRIEVVHERPAHLAASVAQAVSEATGVPIEAMETNLGDIVDPDALNHLFADRINGRPRRGGCVSFSLLDCRVEVNADGRIVVEPQ